MLSLDFLKLILLTCRQLLATPSTVPAWVGLKGASWQRLSLSLSTGKRLLCFFLLPAWRDRYFCLWSLSSVFFLLLLNGSLPISPAPCHPTLFATSSFFPYCTVWHRRRREPHQIKECNHKSCLEKQGPRVFFSFSLSFFFASLPFLDLISHNQILPVVLTMWWCVNTLEFCFNQRSGA